MGWGLVSQDPQIQVDIMDDVINVWEIEEINKSAPYEYQAIDAKVYN